MPKNPAEALAGPRVLARWRGHGRLGRWSDVRQRFFLALLTDPERARRGLALLDRLGTDPHPGTRAAELAALEAWLAAQAADIVAPRNRFEHAVTATRALWPQLSAADDPATRRKLVEAPWTLEADPPGPEADLLWVSLVESCAALGLPLWAYLHDLLRARANDPQFAPKDWTPLARAAHP